jgi:transcriptional regulator with XRE-family HTH domain
MVRYPAPARSSATPRMSGFTPNSSCATITPEGACSAAGRERREEVALLASLSTTYYTFLEQGRPVRPSAQVLDALAAARPRSSATPA